MVDFHFKANVFWVLQPLIFLFVCGKENPSYVFNFVFQFLKAFYVKITLWNYMKALIKPEIATNITANKVNFNYQLFI